MNNSNKMCAILSNAMTYDKLAPLTTDRPLATLPFDCKYRLIDFPLSSLSNGNVKTVFMVFNQGETQSVFDHIRSGKEWGLDSLSAHMFVYIQQDFERKKDKGLPYFESQINFLKMSNSPYTVLIGSKIIANVDLQAVLKIHQSSDKHITTVYKKMSSSDFEPTDTVVRFDQNNRVYGVDFRQIEEEATVQEFENLSLNTFIVDTDWLIEFIQEMQDKGEYASVSRLLRNHLWDTDTNTYEYTGYISNILDIKSYYDANMAMLEPSNFTSLLYGAKPVYTKIKNEVPTYFSENSWAHRSQFGSGCIVKGVVMDSIISRGTIIESDTIVDKSLVFTSAHIKKGAQVKYAIIDKNVVIEGVKIEGSAENPIVIPKGAHVTEDIIAN
ncbi:MAG: glucose-1-phosphate adenylyltransferase subunit GlgD [Streptococcaceae bacterium]|jgi:glucose-1-phosphate adenylyltransferase|nr:glucose-1-phosphate adenylyltransferase subunit GlgD [Streptococcaceae bacterium]